MKIIQDKIKEFQEKYGSFFNGLAAVDGPRIYQEQEEMEQWLSQALQEVYIKGREETQKVEGLSALIKFIRNKARRDIMKADLYGQGYYQAIKDMENYFGISEIDELSHLSKRGGKEE